MAQKTAEDSIVQALPSPPAGKPPLDHDSLRDVVELTLWAGQLLLQNGAETTIVEETAHRIGTALGCDWADILVSPNALIITTVSGGEFRTRVRRVVRIGVNYTIVSAINNLSRRIEQGELDRFGVRAELVRISSLKPHYNRWLTTFMAGLSCAAFSRLFGGDWPAFAVTFGAAFVAATVRHELLHRHFNTLLVVVATAFVAGLLAGSATLLALSATPAVPLLAAVLLLVPGVPLINAVEDMMKGHMVTGLVRGFTGFLILLGIALGLLLALTLLRLQPL